MTWRVRAVLIVIAAAAVAAGGYFIFRPRVSDRDKIIRALLGAANAVQRKDVRETMAVVSEDYHDAAGLNKRLLRLLAWRGREIEGRLQVAMSVPEVAVNDGEAAAEAQVSVYLIDSSGGSRILFDGPVSFTLRRESRGRWRVVDSGGWQQAIEIEQGF